jgi:hypothetical protein
MSAILWLGGALYLLAVHFTVGKRYDADFISWQEQLKRVTYRSVFSVNAGSSIIKDTHK